MELQKIRELLTAIALDHSKQKPDEAIQSIALALLHMAEGISEIQSQLHALSLRPTQGE
jgi:hypothetical protein